MREKLKRGVLFIMVFSLLMSISATATEVYAASKEVALNKMKVTVAVGETVQLKLKNAPKGKNVTWNINNKSVATVSKNGKVKAKRVETA